MDKKLVQQYLKKGDKIKTTIIYDDGKNFELNVKGEIKTVADSGFSKKQLEQLGQLMDYKLTNALTPIVQRLDKIESRLDGVEQRLDRVEKRLDVLESDVKILKSFHKEDINKLNQ